MPPIRSPIPAVPKQDAPPVPFGLGELGPLNTGVDMTRPDALGYERFRADRVISNLSRQRNDRQLAQQSRFNAHQRARNWIRDRDAFESGADFGLGELGQQGRGAAAHAGLSPSFRLSPFFRPVPPVRPPTPAYGLSELGPTGTGGYNPSAMMQRYRQLEQEGRLFNPATGQPTIPLQPEYYQQRGAENLARGAAGFVPVVGTAVNWNQMGPGERAFSMGLDAVDIATLGAGKALTAPARWGGRAIRNIFGRSDAVAPSLASGPAAPSPRYFPRQSRTYPARPGGTNYSPIDALRPMMPPTRPMGQGGSTRLLRDPVRATEYSNPAIWDRRPGFGSSLPYTTFGRGLNQPYAGSSDNRAPGEGLFNPISPSF